MEIQIKIKDTEKVSLDIRKQTYDKIIASDFFKNELKTLINKKFLEAYTVK